MRGMTGTGLLAEDSQELPLAKNTGAGNGFSLAAVAAPVLPERPWWVISWGLLKNRKTSYSDEIA